MRAARRIQQDVGRFNLATRDLLGEAFGSALIDGTFEKNRPALLGRKAGLLVRRRNEID